VPTFKVSTLNTAPLKLQATGFRLKVKVNKVMRDFKKLLIWQLGMDIVDKVYDAVAHLPLEEKYGLKSQMTRSASSIPSNIAEGSAKRSVKEYVRYVEISQGSAFELETHALIVSRRNWVREELISELVEMVRQEQKMISKFIDKLGGD
jgi:four helix bundle protein